MQAQAWDWANLLLRWLHLVAGIGWIGSSFYFMWLDSALEAPKPPKAGVDGMLWMVHSGGFYQVEKRRIGPDSMPGVLHWFKWEALLTWVSGMLLLGVVYYLSGGVFLIDKGRLALGTGPAVALSLAVVVVAWLVYDGLFASRIAERLPRVATGVSFALLFGLVFGLCHAFSGRAAFVHVGAVLGTLMVANVWRRILPAQQQMIDATKAGRAPDYGLGLKAKRRSVHNSYLTLPVIFMMLSNHYPSLYGHALNWLTLALMIVLGATVRHIMIVNGKGKNGWLWLAPAGATLVALVGLTVHPTAGPASGASAAPSASVADATAEAIVRSRCLSCHGSTPTDDVFTTPPNGVVLETLAQVRALADRVRLRVVETRTMPLANKTDMTDEERAVLGAWLAEP